MSSMGIRQHENDVGTMQKINELALILSYPVVYVQACEWCSDAAFNTQSSN